jgi:hypothetical protein
MTSLSACSSNKQSHPVQDVSKAGGISSSETSDFDIGTSKITFHEISYEVPQNWIPQTPTKTKDSESILYVPERSMNDGINKAALCVQVLDYSDYWNLADEAELSSAYEYAVDGIKGADDIEDFLMEDASGYNLPGKQVSYKSAEQNNITFVDGLLFPSGNNMVFISMYTIEPFVDSFDEDFNKILNSIIAQPVKTTTDTNEPALSNVEVSKYLVSINPEMGDIEYSEIIDESGRTGLQVDFKLNTKGEALKHDIAAEYTSYLSDVINHFRGNFPYNTFMASMYLDDELAVLYSASYDSDFSGSLYVFERANAGLKKSIEELYENDAVLSNTDIAMGFEDDLKNITEKYIN